MTSCLIQHLHFKVKEKYICILFYFSKLNIKMTTLKYHRSTSILQLEWLYTSSSQQAHYVSCRSADNECLACFDPPTSKGMERFLIT